MPSEDVGTENRTILAKRRAAEVALETDELLRKKTNEFFNSLLEVAQQIHPQPTRNDVVDDASLLVRKYGQEWAKETEEKPK